MPILSFEVVGDIQQAQTQALANAAGKIMGTGPGKTWVKFQVIPPEYYAENDTPSSAKPVFISVIQGRGYDPLNHGKLALEMAETFAPILKRPKENIHIIFEPDANNRIAFGGKLLMRDAT